MEIIADIELNKRSNPRAVVMLVKILTKADLNLSMVQHSKAEKHLRELVSLPSNMFTSDK